MLTAEQFGYVLDRLPGRHQIEVHRRAVSQLEHQAGAGEQSAGRFDADGDDLVEGNGGVERAAARAPALLLVDVDGAVAHGEPHRKRRLRGDGGRVERLASSLGPVAREAGEVEVGVDRHPSPVHARPHLRIHPLAHGEHEAGKGEGAAAGHHDPTDRSEGAGADQAEGHGAEPEGAEPEGPTTAALRRSRRSGRPRRSIHRCDCRGADGSYARRRGGGSAMTIGIGVLVTLLVGLWIGVMVLWILSIVEVVRLPEAQYQAAGTDKTTWVVVVVMLGFIAAIVWRVTKRKDVLAAPPPFSG